MLSEMNTDTDFISGLWSERILAVTEDYEITGRVFMPKTGKRARFLTDILNGERRFVAIKNCKIIHRKLEDRRVEFHEFLQLNVNSIILLRPLEDDE